MGLFDFFKKKNGHMYAVRCDEKDFLIWKWRPVGQEANTTSDENAICTGSSLNVRPGQAAVFLYQQSEGEYDIIKGPYNGTITSQNMPVLSSITGVSSNGTPFQAEVYYFNLAKNMEIPFTIPYFRVVPAEPEFKAYDVEVAIKGSLVFEVPAEKEYLKYLFEAWGGNDTSLAELEQKLKSLLTQEVKQIIANAPKEKGIFVMHFNSLIGELGQYILARLQDKIASRFGVLATDVTISDIRFDEDLSGYQNLKRVTETQSHLFNLEKEKTALLEMQIQRENMQTAADVRNKNAARIAEMQRNRPNDIAARLKSGLPIPQKKNQ